MSKLDDAAARWREAVKNLQDVMAERDRLSASLREVEEDVQHAQRIANDARMAVFREAADGMEIYVNERF